MGAWMIRAGRGGAYAADWLDRGIVGIGWDFNNADIANMGKDELRNLYATLHPSMNHGQIGQATGQAFRFASDITIGETVVTYDPEGRTYYIGEIVGPCVASQDREDTTYLRKVKWTRSTARDELGTSTKNALGSLTTIFSIPDRIMAEMINPSSTENVEATVAPENQGADDEEARYATYDDGIERIKDRVNALDWEDMERLVAGLLKAMGYCARVMPKGPDGGRDVVASPDALGLESPRIVAEVKHRKGAMGAPAVRSFIGGLRAGDRGLYVSTGGFSKEARYEADRANVPVRLLDLDGFVRLYVESYDKTDEDTRAILPLVRIWWPA